MLISDGTHCSLGREDSGHQTRDEEDGSWPASLTPVAATQTRVSVSLSLVSGVITRVSHGQALVTSGHSHIRHEATGQLAEDETLKSIPFETGGSSMANESNIILLLSVYYRHTYGLLNACIAQAAVILDRGRESTRMELLSLTGLGPLDSGLLTLSALSRCHLISLNPLSVAQKLSPANTDY